MDCITLAANEDCTNEGFVFEIKSLYAYLKRVEDPRKPKGLRYPLEQLILLIMLAKMGGESEPTGISEWVKHREENLVKMLKLTRPQVPHYCTFSRVLKKLDSDLFDQIMGEYQRNKAQGTQEVIICIDGKTLRGTIEKGHGRGIHLLAAFLPGSGLVLMQVAVEYKENEIVAAPKVLQALDLDGAIVMGDAMHTQRNLSVQIVEGGGDYLWTVKNNQPRTKWAIEKLFVHEMVNFKKGAPLSRDFQMAVGKTTKEHGRIERRTIFVSQALNDYLDWPHVAQVFRLEREVWHEYGQKKSRQIVYGLTSLSPNKADPERLLELSRTYWGIENGLHYRRDVTLQEDATRSTAGNTGRNLAIINNLIIALTLSNGFHNLPKARRLFNAKPEQALDLIRRENCLLC